MFGKNTRELRKKLHDLNMEVEALQRWIRQVDHDQTLLKTNVHIMNINADSAQQRVYDYLGVEEVVTPAERKLQKIKKKL